MGRLGTPLLLVYSSILPEAIDDMSRVGFEALAWGRHINDYRQAGRRCGTPTMSRSA